VKIQIMRFAQIAQNNAVCMSEFVRKTISRFYDSCFREPSPSARGRQNRLIRLGDFIIARMRLRLKYGFPTVQAMHAYEVRPRKDHRGADLISNALESF
jgi:hypothetical protein